ncbi:AraC-like ligand-binding domain-containing protein [Amycolatopsis pigmentata]|uniref:Helix-turn-helix domain-containing protein n=1 Tax=Amycolatopsis pigmentata TaxID=450801 RepID=A0ABW5G1F7_9PSEU
MDVISTAEVPARERFAFWREVSSKLWVPYDLRCAPDVESHFQARVGIGEFGPVQATVLTTTPHIVQRTERLIRQTDPEVFKVGCLIRGGGIMEQDGRQAGLCAGDLVLFDTSRPFRGWHSPGGSASRLLLLQFPRSLLPLPAGDVRRLSGIPIRGGKGLGALASRFLLELARRMDEFDPAEAARLPMLTLDVLTAALASGLDAESSVPPHTARRALMARIHAFIRDNLGDPDLSPATIAAAHHISPRYLHKLFQAEERTVAGWIRERRLAGCRRDLADPRLATQPINVIAARWGFSSASHFSHAFRGAYGFSPRQFRRSPNDGARGHNSCALIDNDKPRRGEHSRS